MRCIRFQQAFKRDLLLLLVLCLCFSEVRGTRKCYYPDGTSAKSDGDCSSAGENSACCGKGYICLANGVCLVDPATPGVDEKLAGTLWRGSCTDHGWNTLACPQFCTKTSGPQMGNMGGRQQLGKCPDTENTYYCKPPTGDVDCNDPSKVFEIKAILSKDSMPVVLQPTETLRIQTAATTTCTPNTIISTITSTQLPPSTLAWPTATQTNIPKNTTTANATAPPADDTRSYASRHALAIGVGVGSSVGFSIAIISAILIYYHYRRQSMELEEVYKGPLPPVRPARPDVNSPFDHRVVGMLPRDRGPEWDKLDPPPLGPLFLSPLQYPLPLSPVLESVGEAL